MLCKKSTSTEVPTFESYSIMSPGALEQVSANSSVTWRLLHNVWGSSCKPREVSIMHTVNVIVDSNQNAGHCQWGDGSSRRVKCACRVPLLLYRGPPTSSGRQDWTGGDCSIATRSRAIAIASEEGKRYRLVLSQKSHTCSNGGCSVSGSRNGLSGTVDC